MIKDDPVVSRVEVRASTKEFSRYRKLVDSDWNKETFDAVVELMWDVVKDSAPETHGPVELAFLKNMHDRKRASAIPAVFRRST